MTVALGDQVTGQPSRSLAQSQAIQVGWSLLVYMKVDTLISLSPLDLQLGSKTPNSTPTAFSCVLMLHVQSPDQWVSVTAAPQLVWTFSWLCISLWCPLTVKIKLCRRKREALRTRKATENITLKRKNVLPSVYCLNMDLGLSLDWFLNCSTEAFTPQHLEKNHRPPPHYQPLSIIR